MIHRDCVQQVSQKDQSPASNTEDLPMHPLIASVVSEGFPGRPKRRIFDVS